MTPVSDSPLPPNPLAEAWLAALNRRTATVGVIGLGYVGLPLALSFCEAGFRAIGFDTDPAKVEALGRGRSYIGQFPDERVAAAVASGRLAASGAFSRLPECDAVVICVPTPLDAHREPDLRFVVATAEAVASHLRPGQLVVLESSTYPGTTAEVLRPRMEARGLRVGEEVFLAFSPEREDPGNAVHSTRTIPKVVGADDERSAALASALYRGLSIPVVPVSSTRAAEAAKLLENIFRAVNIALVNEMKTVLGTMGVDVWEVIEAARTKPFGFMPFYPGPGLGGHCIPIDPFYLTWKAREFDTPVRLIELAGEINTAMPRQVVDATAAALSDRFRKAVNGSRVLVVGVAYKKNVDDLRESPGIRIMSLLEQRGALVAFHDPHVPVLTAMREHPTYLGRRSVPLTAEEVRSRDAVLIVADHDRIDYALLADAAPLLVDTRNAIRTRLPGRAYANLVLA